MTVSTTPSSGVDTLEIMIGSAIASTERLVIASGRTGAGEARVIPTLSRRSASGGTHRPSSRGQSDRAKGADEAAQKNGARRPRPLLPLYVGYAVFLAM